VRALMQLREGTGEEVFFHILQKSPHFTAIFPTGRANSSDSVDKLMINHWTKDNYKDDVSSVSPSSERIRRANAQNVSFITRYGGQFTFST